MKLRSLGPNQTEISVDGVTLFFSYATPVAAEVGGQHYQTQAKFSSTTSKHVSRWLAGVEAKQKPQTFFDGLLVARKGEL